MKHSTLFRAAILCSTLSLSFNGFSQDLYVASGDTLWVQPGGLLTVEGSISSSGSVYLQADATGYAQLQQVNNVSNTGNVDMEMYLTDMYDGWRHLAVPFTNNLNTVKLGGLSFITSANDGGLAGRRSVYYWDATDNGMGNNEANGWTEAPFNKSGVSAFTVYGAQNGWHDFSQTIRMGGAPANGDISFALKNTYDIGQTGNANARGWNFIPNPYPSNISAQKLFALTNFPTYKAIHVWDNDNQQYEAITTSGVSVYNTNASANAATHIQPFQGFWVKANADVTLTIDNTVREPDSTATAFLQAKPYDLLRLAVTNHNDSTLDKMVVFFGPDASLGIDNGYDAYKVKSTEDVPTMYMEHHGLDLSMNYLPIGSYSIPVTVATQQNQTSHTFSLDDSQLDAAWTVELEDLAGHKRVDLRKQNLTTNIDVNDSKKRFILHLNNTTVSMVEQKLQAELIGWADANGDINVRKLGLGNGTISLYGLDGKLYASQRMDDSQITMRTPRTGGVYILHFTSDDLGTFSQKVLVP